MNLYNIFQKVNHYGGITIDRKGSEYKGLGYAVALSQDTEIIIDDELFIPELIQAVTRKYAEQLKKNNVFLGIWKDNGKIYFDLSEIIEDFQEAIEKGNNRNQLAIFDFNTKQVIEIKGE